MEIMTGGDFIVERILIRRGAVGVSSRQETVCERFPIRHGGHVIHDGRKLFANGFSFDMKPM